jgi:hypothetical protein
MFLQNLGVGTLTVTPTTSTVDGAASLALTTGQGVLICSDGTNYFTSRGIGGAAGGTPSEVLISEQTPSGTGVVTFSSLGSYRSLRITGMGRGTNATTSVQARLTFNTDTGTNYRNQGVYGSNATASAFNGLTDAYVLAADIAAASAPASVPSTFEIYIPDYAGTTFFKATNGQYGLKTGTTAASHLAVCVSSWWVSTAAITRIDITLSAGNWVAGTRISLYGVS